jgi:hypothetical protein
VPIHSQAGHADLMERLLGAGYAHPHPRMDRLRERIAETIDKLRGGQEAALAKFQQELLGEMASSLGRAEERLLVAYLELDLLAKSPAADFNAKRKQVLQLRWEYIVTREAVGHRRHTDVDALYPIPPLRR